MSLSLGITPAGFVMPDYNSYSQYIINLLKAQIPNIDLTSGSVNDILLSLHINASYEMLEVLENLYYQTFPSTATGVNLDRIVSFANLARVKATYTTVDMVFSGVNGSVVSAGTIVKDVDSLLQFTNEDSFVLSAASCYAVTLKLESMVGVDYGLSINGVYIGVGNTSQSTSDAIDQIKNLFTLKDLSVNLIFTKIDSERFSIQATDIATVFSANFNQNTLKVESVSAVWQFRALERGSVYLNANTLKFLSLPVAGISSVNNPLDGIAGVNIETDIQLRQRFFNIGKNSRNFATTEAIISAFQNPNLIENISYVNLIENRTNNTDSNGLPAHTICLIVSGGDNSNIANLLWKTSPAGINFYGNTQVSIKDSLGNPQLISFTRPSSVYIYIKIKTFVKYGQFLASVDTQKIINSVLEYGKNLKAGDDVYVNVMSAYGLLAASDVLENIEVQIGSSLNSNVQATAFASSDIQISITQAAVFNQNFISFI